MVFVRPNKYEAKRANVIVYNWDSASSVAVNLPGVLNAGDQYVIQDAQNFYGPAVASGTYAGGSINLPMNSTAKATPVGFVAPAHTGARFGAFVVLPAFAPAGISVVVTPTTATLAQSQQQQLNATVQRFQPGGHMVDKSGHRHGVELRSVQCTGDDQQ